jgi:hypothetical protein
MSGNMCPFRVAQEGSIGICIKSGCKFWVNPPFSEEECVFISNFRVNEEIASTLSNIEDRLEQIEMQGS